MWLGRKRRGAREGGEMASLAPKRDYRAQRRAGAVRVGGVAARGQRQAFLKAGRPPKGADEPPKPMPKPGRAPTRVIRLRRQAADAIQDVVLSVTRKLVTKLEVREERRLQAAKIAAGRMLPPVTESERAVSRAIEALNASDETKREAVERSRVIIAEHEQARRLKLEKIEAFEEAKRGVSEAGPCAIGRGASTSARPDRPP